MSKRREFSAQFKLETVLEGLRGEKSVAQICRERDITDSLYYKWRDEDRRFGAGGHGWCASCAS
jgi:transposase-like protein